MERRSEARHRVDQPARLTLLGRAQPPLAAQLVDISPHGLQVALPKPVAGGLPVCVESGSSRYLGEVCYCRPQRTGAGFLAGVTVEQVLTMTGRLEELRDALLCGR